MFRLTQQKIISSGNAHIVSYGTPSNLNFVWSLGAMSGLCLVLQVLTGIFLAMHYVGDASMAFHSVQKIMMEVKFGWLIRYLHANGASVFFLVVYAHIFKAIYYGSYIKPRQFVWYIGIIIFILMMATAFIGYVLPWGQMSLWGATVITNLFGAIPFVGDSITKVLWGGYSVSAPTLNRFVSFHFLLPYVLLALVTIHLVVLHASGSNNPTGSDKASVTTFYPAFGIKDVETAIITLAILAIIYTFVPNALGHPDNWIPADPMKTPPHIVPEWYFLPFYAILRAIPNKLGGVVAMFMALLILFILPSVNTSLARGSTFRPIYSKAVWLLLFDVLLLGWLGQTPVEAPYILAGRICTIYYFVFFIVLVPVIGLVERRFIFKN